MKRVLFFTPYGLINGSGVMLWNILQHFDRSQLQAAVYCGESGPLVDNTPSDVALYESPFGKGRWRDALLKSVNATGYNVYEKNIIRIHQQFKPDFWYLNTVLMFHLTPLAERLGVRVIAQINELNSMYESISYKEMEHAITHAELTVGITQHICTLASQMGAQKTALQHCFTSTSLNTIAIDRSIQLRNSLKLAEGVFIWIMVGTPIYRKGVDFIPSIARALNGRLCHILWMGSGAVATGLNYLIDKQIEAMGLRNITFVSVQTDDYQPYLQLADGFVLTSREEPFGNVLIDAASCGKPIVASGEYGAGEFILPGMGELVDYASPAHFVEAMVTIMDNPGEYSHDLSVARSHTFDAYTQVRHWQELINTLP